MAKVVLAYSGGLDTSVAIKWLQDHYGREVITVTVDVGQDLDGEAIRRKALESGASHAYFIDARDDFVRDFAFRALKAGAVYEDRYPLASALSRPLITRLLVETARREGADSIAHGCTGKGNDQVRFDVSASALAPDLAVIAPAREWGMSREEEIEYALQNGIPVSQGKQNPYSIDANLWGRSIECGILEDPWQEPPEYIYRMTRSPEDCPREAEYVEISFEGGVPVTLNGESLDPVDLVTRLNDMAGAHGIGRIDHVENRLVGIKSREIYEAPAATVLLTAHRDLEDLTLTRDVARLKRELEATYADLIYNGLWYSPLREALDGFVDKTQENVSGTVRLRMQSGNLAVVGRQSECSLYDTALATYDRDDAFDHQAAVGFITIWGLPTRVAARAGQARGISPASGSPPGLAAGGEQGAGSE